MTLNEFKAWFSGFTESMDGVPDEKQWTRIKDRVKEIDNVAITQTVFVDRYVEPYRRYYDRIWYGASPYTAALGTGGSAQMQAVGAVAFNSHSAMLDLGKAEYKACAVS